MIVGGNNSSGGQQSNIWNCDSIVITNFESRISLLEIAGGGKIDKREAIVILLMLSRRTFEVF